MERGTARERERRDELYRRMKWRRWKNGRQGENNQRKGEKKERKVGKGKWVQIPAETLARSEKGSIGIA